MRKGPLSTRHSPISDRETITRMPSIYIQAQHGIQESLIDSDALYVTNRLREAGFIAYVVGGSVRDILLGIVPKDFDISTSAKPEEVKRIFGRSCLLIGRRFRLAHVRFGHKVVEVATFRSGENDSDLIVQDNEWGNAEEDVLRRDFTINGLCYDSAERTVIDYVNGWSDLKNRVLRTIGDPDIRFRQDPVRMIRLLKFQARLGFSVDQDCRSAMLRCREEIVKSSSARVLEEILRMLESGSSASFFQLTAEEGILEMLIPCLNHFLNGSHRNDVINLLSAADLYHLKCGRRRLLDRSVLLACLFYPILEQEVIVKSAEKGRSLHIGDIIMLTNAVVSGVIISSFFSHFPKRISALLTFVLSTQYRFTPLSGKRHHNPKLFHNKEFFLALQLFQLRATANKALSNDYESWNSLYRQFEKQGDKRSHHPPPTDHKVHPQRHHEG